MDIVISNVLVWTIVLLVLWDLKIKVSEKKQDVSAYEKATNRDEEFDNYIIEYGKGLKIIVTVGVIFFGAIFFVNYATYFWGWELGKGINQGTVVLFGLMLLFYITSFSGIVIWKIKVNGDDIYYTNYFGIVRNYKFTELDKVYVNKNHKIIAYYKNQKIFSIDNNVAMGAYFMISARKYNVRIEQD